MKKNFTYLIIVLLTAFGFTAKAQTYTVDFEAETKPSWASADVELGAPSPILWNLTDVLIAKRSMGNSDFFGGGDGSMRLRGYATTAATMLANKPGGIGSITFQYAKYGNDSQVPYKVEWSADGANWTAVGEEFTATETPQTFSADINQVNARIRIVAVSTGTTNKRMNIDNIVMTDAGSLPSTPTPTFSPEPGDYIAPINVTIECSLAGASIYFTIDGTEPNNQGNGTQYTAAIPVSSTTTIKAIAYADGYQPSPVATGVYNFLEITDVANIAALRAGEAGQHYRLTGEVILTLKTATRNAKYVQDATAAILIDDNAGVITTDYHVGDGITNLVVKLGSYSNMLQAIPVMDSGAPTSTGNTITPQIITLSQLSDDYQAQLITVNNVTIAETGNFEASTNYSITDPSGEGVLRIAYSDLPLVGEAIPTGEQNITGVVLRFQNIFQIVPLSISSTSSIENLSANIKVYADNKNIYISNDGSISLISIYNSNGQKIAENGAINGLNTISVPVKGLYILKLDNHAMKVLVR